MANPPAGRSPVAAEADHAPSPTHTSREVHVGDPQELGAVWDGSGTNFAVHSSVAERVEVCLFDAQGREERVELPEMTGYVWHGYLPGVGPRQRYGFRAHGPWDPAAGLRCNPARLLVDPYALAVEGGVTWVPEVLGHEPSDPRRRGRGDSAPY